MAVEEPPFRLRLREGAYELRDYPPLTVAEVAVGGDQNHAVSGGFRMLAAYIFGGNHRGEHIAMTAPVIQTPSSGGLATPAQVLETQAVNRWVVRFTMPGQYGLKALPAPNDARVRLRLTPPMRVAVLRFSGLAQKDRVQAMALELGAWVRAHHLRTAGSILLAQYDPPWTLWFMRRNEVMIPRRELISLKPVSTFGYHALAPPLRPWRRTRRSAAATACARAPSPPRSPPAA